MFLSLMFFLLGTQNMDTALNLDELMYDEDCYLIAKDLAPVFYHSLYWA